MDQAMEQAGPGFGFVRVVLESGITVPTDHVEALLAAFRRAGIEAWDTGQRVTTEEAIDAQAELRVRVPA
jgi:methylmalonyl-CoA mutase cobalamin-binding subunit